MRDPQIDEIKSRVSIVQLVQEYFPLKKAGTNWKGLCPFHGEKTPSFMVSDDRMIFHCFGCGEGGDIFTFLQKIEGYDFPEVLKLLADRAGVKIEHRDPRIQHERNLIAEIIDLSARFYRKVLTHASQAEPARQYLASRDLRPETQQTFGIGFAPDGWELLSQFLGKRGYKDDDIIRSGMGLRSVNGRGLYDRFRKRIMFPIRNHQGIVIGFTGRLLPEDEKKPEAGGKYVNTPETPLYHKGEVLYGLDLAKHEIKKEDAAVLVEGNMDVISSHQAGVRNVIAASGTALTDAQLRLLSRYTERIAVAFDADAAGDIAARRGILTALQNGFSVRVINIPQTSGKDPDDCIRKNPILWKNAIADAQDIIEYLIVRARAKFDLRSIEGKKAALVQILPVIAQCGDDVAQAHYVHQVAETISLPDDVIRSEMNAVKRAPQRLETPAPDRPVQKADVLRRSRLLSERLMALYIGAPQTRELVHAGLKPEYLDGEDLQDLYRWGVSQYTTTHTTSDVGQSERTAELSAILPLMLDAVPSAKPAEETKEILSGLVELHRKAGRERIESDMREAERRGDNARIAELAKLFGEL